MINGADVLKFDHVSPLGGVRVAVGKWQGRNFDVDRLERQNFTIDGSEQVECCRLMATLGMDFGMFALCRGLGQE